MSGAELAVIGAIVSAAGTVAQGVAANNAAKFNARMQEQQAARERQIAGQEADDFHRKQRRLLAAARARRAGSGVAMEGSPLLVDDATVEEIEYQTERVRRAGQVRGTSLENQAMLSRSRGKNARTAGFFKAGSTLLTATGEYIDKQK